MNNFRPTQEVRTITLNELRNHFGKGRFATVVFKKKSDGSMRTLNGKTNVVKAINGEGARYDAADYNQLRVFDVNAKDANGVRTGGYRTVTVDRVKEVRANKVIYKIARDIIDGVPFINKVSWTGQTLVVQMNDVNIYYYFGVPFNTFKGFANAESKGKFFNEHIKGKFDFRKVK